TREQVMASTVSSGDLHADSVDASQPTKDRDDCAICLDPLPSMRTLHLLPCKHTFHRKCVLRWLDEKKFRTEQTCPVCRQEDKNDYLCLPFGSSRMPTRRFLYYMLEWNRSDCINCLIGSLERKNTVVLDQVSAEFAHAKETVGIQEIYLNDFVEEIERLVRRGEIYTEMHQLWQEGGLRRSTRVDRAWDLQLERTTEHEEVDTPLDDIETASRELRRVQEERERLADSLRELDQRLLELRARRDGIIQRRQIAEAGGHNANARRRTTSAVDANRSLATGVAQPSSTAGVEAQQEERAGRPRIYNLLRRRIAQGRRDSEPGRETGARLSARWINEDEERADRLDAIRDDARRRAEEGRIRRDERRRRRERAAEIDGNRQIIEDLMNDLGFPHEDVMRILNMNGAPEEMVREMRAQEITPRHGIIERPISASSMGVAMNDEDEDGGYPMAVDQIERERTMGQRQQYVPRSRQSYNEAVLASSFDSSDTETGSMTLRFDETSLERRRLERIDQRRREEQGRLLERPLSTPHEIQLSSDTSVNGAQQDDDDRVIAAEIERDRLAQLARDRAMRAQRQREAHRDRAHFGGFSADSSDRHAEQDPVMEVDRTIERRRLEQIERDRAMRAQRPTAGCASSTSTPATRTLSSSDSLETVDEQDEPDIPEIELRVPEQIERDRAIRAQARSPP
ncbi:hypothetical protein PRIPAC_93774, partial [Pristionchus pacificus]